MGVHVDHGCHGDFLYGPTGSLTPGLPPLKRLARSVALIGEQAPATGTRATMKGDARIGCRGIGFWSGLLGQSLPPQLLNAGSDRFEIVSCSGP
jgi:hypothetical protein